MLKAQRNGNSSQNIRSISESSCAMTLSQGRRAGPCQYMASEMVSTSPLPFSHTKSTHQQKSARSKLSLHNLIQFYWPLHSNAVQRCKGVYPDHCFLPASHPYSITSSGPVSLFHRSEPPYPLPTVPSYPYRFFRIIYLKHNPSTLPPQNASQTSPSQTSPLILSLQLSGGIASSPSLTTPS